MNTLVAALSGRKKMGGSSKKKTTQTYKPPDYVEEGAKTAVGIGQRIAGQQYTPYTKERIAPLSKNEQQGVQLASDSVGVGQPYFNKAEKYATRGTQQFKDTDINQYINPFVKGALDPAAREIKEQGLRTGHQLESRSSSMDAFGGSRAALLQSENYEKTQQTLSDLYATGHKQAWDFGVKTWGEERARDLLAAGRFESLGRDVVNEASTDVSNLMTTGATDRNVQQAVKDFDYKQFIENRDWDFRALSGMITALQGSKGSYSTTSTSTTKQSSDAFSQVLGLAAEAIGAYIASGGSDVRLKKNIVYLGLFMGQRIYSWAWNKLAYAVGFDKYPTVGVIAQEVHPDYLSLSNGFLMVNYGKLFRLSGD